MTGAILERSSQLTRKEVESGRKRKKPKKIENKEKSSLQ
jgi:hypothetical protein